MGDRLGKGERERKGGRGGGRRWEEVGGGGGGGRRETERTSLYNLRLDLLI